MAQGFKIYGDLEIRVDNLRPVVSQVQQQLGTIKANVNATVSPASARGVSGLTASAQALAAQLTNVQNVAKSVNAAFSQGGIARGAGGFNDLNKQINQTVNQLHAVQQKVGDTATEMYKFGQQSALAGRRFLAFGLGALTFIKLSGAIREASTEAFEFQRNMVRLSQLGAVSAQEVNETAESITRLSTSLGVSSKELADATIYLKGAGLSINEVKDSLQALAKASLSPTFGNIRETTEGLIAARQQFDLTSKDFEGVLGSINTVAQGFAAESEDLIEAIRRAGGAFRAASGDMAPAREQFNQLIALFTSVRSTTRESAESIATSFRTIFARLQSNDVVKNLKELGVNLRFTGDEARLMGRDVEGQFVGAYNAIERLSKAVRGIPTTDPRFAAIISEIGGSRQVSKVIPLLQQFGTAQKALAAAQSGTSSLQRDSVKAQDAYLNRLAKLREEFQELFRIVTQSKGFSRVLDIFIQGATAATQLVKALEPLLPLLTAIAAVKIGQAAISFGRGFVNPPSVLGGRRFSSGGIVPGRGDRDSYHTSLPVGSYVIKKAVAKKLPSQVVGHLIGGNAPPAGRMTPVSLMPEEIAVYPKRVKEIGRSRLDALNSGRVAAARGGPIKAVPNPIDVDALYESRRGNNAGRSRRYSTDKARKLFYGRHRLRRFNNAAEQGLFGKYAEEYEARRARYGERKYALGYATGGAVTLNPRAILARQKSLRPQLKVVAPPISSQANIYARLAERLKQRAVEAGVPTSELMRVGRYTPGKPVEFGPGRKQGFASGGIIVPQPFRTVFDRGGFRDVDYDSTLNSFNVVQRMKDASGKFYFRDKKAVIARNGRRAEDTAAHEVLGHAIDWSAGKDRFASTIPGHPFHDVAKTSMPFFRMFDLHKQYEKDEHPYESLANAVETYTSGVNKYGSYGKYRLRPMVATMPKVKHALDAVHGIYLPEARRLLPRRYAAGGPVENPVPADFRKKLEELGFHGIDLTRAVKSFGVAPQLGQTQTARGVFNPATQAVKIRENLEDPLPTVAHEAIGHGLDRAEARRLGLSSTYASQHVRPGNVFRQSSQLASRFIAEGLNNPNRFQPYIDKGQTDLHHEQFAHGISEYIRVKQGQYGPEVAAHPAFKAYASHLENVVLPHARQHFGQPGAMGVATQTPLPMAAEVQPAPQATTPVRPTRPQIGIARGTQLNKEQEQLYANLKAQYLHLSPNEFDSLLASSPATRHLVHPDQPPATPEEVARFTAPPPKPVVSLPGDATVEQQANAPTIVGHLAKLTHGQRVSLGAVRTQLGVKDETDPRFHQFLASFPEFRDKGLAAPHVQPLPEDEVQAMLAKAPKQQALRTRLGMQPESTATTQRKSRIILPKGIAPEFHETYRTYHRMAHESIPREMFHQALKQVGATNLLGEEVPSRNPKMTEELAERILSGEPLDPRKAFRKGAKEHQFSQITSSEGETRVIDLPDVKANPADLGVIEPPSAVPDKPTIHPTVAAAPKKAFDVAIHAGPEGAPQTPEVQEFLRNTEKFQKAGGFTHKHVQALHTFAREAAHTGQVDITPEKAEALGLPKTLVQTREGQRGAANAISSILRPHNLELGGLTFNEAGGNVRGNAAVVRRTIPETPKPVTPQVAPGPLGHVPEAEREDVQFAQDVLAKGNATPQTAARAEALLKKYNVPLPSVAAQPQPQAVTPPATPVATPPPVVPPPTPVTPTVSDFTHPDPRVKGVVEREAKRRGMAPQEVYDEIKGRVSKAAAEGVPFNIGYNKPGKDLLHAHKAAAREQGLDIKADVTNDKTAYKIATAPRRPEGELVQQFLAGNPQGYTSVTDIEARLQKSKAEGRRYALHPQIRPEKEAAFRAVAERLDAPVLKVSPKAAAGLKATHADFDPDDLTPEAKAEFEARQATKRPPGRPRGSRTTPVQPPTTPPGAGGGGGRGRGPTPPSGGGPRGPNDPVVALLQKILSATQAGNKVLGNIHGVVKAGGIGTPTVDRKTTPITRTKRTAKVAPTTTPISQGVYDIADAMHTGLPERLHDITANREIATGTIPVVGDVGDTRNENRIPTPRSQITPIAQDVRGTRLTRQQREDIKRGALQEGAEELKVPYLSPEQPLSRGYMAAALRRERAFLQQTRSRQTDVGFPARGGDIGTIPLAGEEGYITRGRRAPGHDVNPLPNAAPEAIYGRRRELDRGQVGRIAAHRFASGLTDRDIQGELDRQAEVLSQNSEVAFNRRGAHFQPVQRETRFTARRLERAQTLRAVRGGTFFKGEGIPLSAPLPDEREAFLQNADVQIPGFRANPNPPQRRPRRQVFGFPTFKRVLGAAPHTMISPLSQEHEFEYERLMATANADQQAALQQVRGREIAAAGGMRKAGGGRIGNFGAGLSRVARAGLGIGVGLATLAPQISESIVGTPEHPGRYGEEGVRTGRGISGALSGAGGGAFMGSFFGPFGTAIGGAVGAIHGFVTATQEADREIRQVRLDRSLSEMDDAIQKVISGQGPLNPRLMGKVDAGLQNFETVEAQNNQMTGSGAGARRFVGGLASFGGAELARLGGNEQGADENLKQGFEGIFGKGGLLGSQGSINKTLGFKFFTGEESVFGKQLLDTPREELAKQRGIEREKFVRENIAPRVGEYRQYNEAIARNVKIPQTLMATGGMNDEQLRVVQQQRIEAFKKAGGEKTAAAVVEATPGMTFDDYFKELDRVIIEANKERVAHEALTKSINRQEIETQKFLRIGQAIDATVADFGNLQHGLDALEAAFSGQLAATPVTSHVAALSNVGGPDTGAFNRGVDFVAGGLNQPAANPLISNFADTAKTLNQTANVLPGIISNAASGGATEENITQEVGKGLEAQGIPKEVRDRIVNVLQGIKPEELGKQASENAQKLAESVLKEGFANVNEVLIQAAKTLEERANAFNAGLLKNQEMINKIGESQDKYANLQVKAAQSQAVIQAESAGRPGQAQLAPETLLAPFQRRQERLTKLGGQDALNPQLIGSRLRDTQVEIDRARKARDQATSPAIQDKAAESLADLQGKAQGLAQALEHLADPVEKNAVLQERLAKLEESRNAKLSFTERMVTATPGELVKMRRNAQFSDIAVQQGSLEGLNFQQRAGALEHLGSLGEAELPGYGGRKASDIRKQLLLNAALASGNIRPEEERGRMDILREQNATDQTAVQAQGEIVRNQQNLQGQFFTELRNLQQEFFNRLATNLAEAQRRDIGIQVGEAGTQVAKVGGATKAADVLSNKFGVTVQQAQLLKGRDDLSSLAATIREQKTFTGRFGDLEQELRAGKGGEVGDLATRGGGEEAQNALISKVAQRLGLTFAESRQEVVGHFDPTKGREGLAEAISSYKGRRSIDLEARKTKLFDTLGQSAFGEVGPTMGQHRQALTDIAGNLNEFERQTKATEGFASNEEVARRGVEAQQKLADAQKAQQATVNQLQQIRTATPQPQVAPPVAGPTAIPEPVTEFPIVPTPPPQPKARVTVAAAIAAANERKKRLSTPLPEVPAMPELPKTIDVGGVRRETTTGRKLGTINDAGNFIAAGGKDLTRYSQAEISGFQQQAGINAPTPQEVRGAKLARAQALADRGSNIPANRLFREVQREDTRGVPERQRPQQATDNMGNFQQNIQSLGNILGGFDKTINNMTSTLSDLANVFRDMKIPDKIQLERQGRIEIVHNGAQLYAALQGDFGKQVREDLMASLKEQLPKLFKEMPA